MNPDPCTVRIGTLVYTFQVEHVDPRQVIIGAGPNSSAGLRAYAAQSWARACDDARLARERAEAHTGDQAERDARPPSPF